MIISVDFDNTLFETNYPEILRPKLGVIDSLKYLRDKGHKVILNTCRCEEYLEEAIESCKKYGLEFDAINENLKDRIDKYKIDSRKISADVYIDDRSLNPSDPCLLLKILDHTNS